MKALLLSLLLLPFSIVAQKLTNDYSIYFSDGDSLNVSSDLLTLSELGSFIGELKDVNGKISVDSVLDTYGRKYVNISYKNEVYLTELLVAGYCNLYAFDSKRYFVRRDTSVFLLENIESVDGNKIIANTRYKGVLIFLSGNSSQTKQRINRMRFRESDIIAIITSINNENSIKSKSYALAKTRIKYNAIDLSNSFNSFNNSFLNILTLNYLNMIYYPSVSKSFSLRLGANVSYLILTTKRDSSKWVNPISERTDVYSLGLPLYFNLEKTNAKFLTPYFFLGLQPSFYYLVEGKDNSSIERSIAAGIRLIGGLGIKAKLNEKHNIRLGLTTDYLIGVGYEYNFRRRHVVR